MARLSRAIIPGVPHFIAQRGNFGRPAFFIDDDYRRFRDIVAESCAIRDVSVWAWAFLPDAALFVVLPRTVKGLRTALGESRRRYSAETNRREGWKGRLWQGRFASFAMDERAALAAIRFVELAPVHAGLTAIAADYPWSSARGHLGDADPLASPSPLTRRVGDWAVFLGNGVSGRVVRDVLRHERTGRPLGDDAFVLDAERRATRNLRPARCGPLPRRWSEISELSPTTAVALLPPLRSEP